MSAKLNILCTKTMIRFARETRGNVLVICVFALIPIIGMVGSGLDMARAYMAQSRLQQACDAGALAGRAQLAATNDSDALALATNMFAQNFPADKYGSRGLNRSFAVDKTRSLTGTASAEMPTTVMRIFGKLTIPIAAGCRAETQLPNVDVMFVLDTTGSMNQANSGDSDSRATVMRAAVLSFYDQVTAAATADAQIRFGFVPYSSSVNVGHLLKPEWLADIASYQSRRPNGTDPNQPPQPDTYRNYNYTKVSGQDNTTYTEKALGEAGGCTPPNGTVQFSNRSEVINSDTIDPATGKRNVLSTITQTQNGTIYWVDTSAGTCRIYQSVRNNFVEKNTRESVYPDNSTIAKLWYYDLIPYDVSAVKTTGLDGYLTGTGSFSASIAGGHRSETVQWNGCIEERQTVNTPTLDPAPSGAYDLQIDAIPTSDGQTRWRPAIPALVFTRWAIDGYYYPGTTVPDNFVRPMDANALLVTCPSKARRLTEMTRSDLTTYLSGLTMQGATYHDIGMIWGARLLSPDGLYKADNIRSRNNGVIARHLILMTDGQSEADPNVYGPYGFEGLDRRRTPTDTAPSVSDLNAIADKRFQAICKAARAKYTVWVIAFGTTLTSNLQNCATPGSAMQASNSSQLTQAFRDIAGKISNLRLTR